MFFKKSMNGLFAQQWRFLCNNFDIKICYNWTMFTVCKKNRFDTFRKVQLYAVCYHFYHQNDVVNCYFAKSMKAKLCICILDISETPNFFFGENSLYARSSTSYRSHNQNNPRICLRWTRVVGSNHHHVHQGLLEVYLGSEQLQSAALYMFLVWNVCRRVHSSLLVSSRSSLKKWRDWSHKSLIMICNLRVIICFNIRSRQIVLTFIDECKKQNQNKIYKVLDLRRF